MTKPDFIRTSKPPFKARYGNFIGGKFVPPAGGRYFENTSPVNGQVLCEVSRSDAADVEAALDAAHAAKDAWGRTSAAERAVTLNAIAQRMEDNLALLASAETWDNGKPIRETMAADLPLAIDHFRYFAGCIRAQEGGISQIDADTVAYHFHEPLGVVGQIIPWNFPLLMALLETGPGPGGRQLRGDQAGRADPGLDPGVGGTHRRPAAAGRPQHRQRFRPGSRQAAGLLAAYRQDRLHRRDHHRAADHAVRQPEPDPRDAGAGRQVAEHLLQGRLRRGRRLPRQGASRAS